VKIVTVEEGRRTLVEWVNTTTLVTNIHWIILNTSSSHLVRCVKVVSLLASKSEDSCSGGSSHYGSGDNSGRNGCGDKIESLALATALNQIIASTVDTLAGDVGSYSSVESVTDKDGAALVNGARELDGDVRARSGSGIADVGGAGIVIVTVDISGVESLSCLSL